MVNELLQKQIELKGLDASFLKVVSEIHEKVDAKTQSKFNNNSIILDEILSCQQYPNDKTSIGFLKVGSGICDKGEPGIIHWGTFCRKPELLARNEKPRYVNASRHKNIIRCWTCNFLRHIAKYCDTIKFYVCDKYGHKSSQCFLKIQQQRKPGWHKAVENCLAHKKRTNVHQNILEGNVSQRHVKSVHNENVTHSIKKIWIRRTSQEHVKDENNKCAIMMSSNFFSH